MQKHISHAENAPTTHIFKHPIIEIVSTHICKDSTVTSFLIRYFYYFSCISVRILNIWDNQRLCSYLSVSSWENLNTGKFIRLDLFLFTGYSRSAATGKYIKYSLDSGKTTRILRKIIKSSSEMAKISRPVQEISKFSEQSLYYCMLIEKINNFLLWTFQHIYHSGGNLQQFTRII